jgi:hypothetical protein
MMTSQQYLAPPRPEPWTLIADPTRCSLNPFTLLGVV